MADVLGTFNRRINELDKAIHNLEGHPIKVEEKSPYKFDYKSGRAQYYKSAVGRAAKNLKSSAWGLTDLHKMCETNEIKILNIINLADRIGKETNTKKVRAMLDEVSDIAEGIKKPPGTQASLKIEVPSMPEAIKNDVSADLREIRRCFDAGCYRSAAILCGRVLETALHRKYFEVTGNDALEKNPGIGLGKLIAKLREQNVEFDPGLTQQIHLINQVRVHTVHKKREAFHPTKSQAHAMVLYTVDVLKKLFA